MNQQATNKGPTLIEKIAERYGVEANKLLVTLKSTAFRGKEPPTNEEMMALLIVANEYGLNPFTKEIYAFPDKHKGIVPVVGVDGWSRICNEHPQYDGLGFNYSDDIAKPDGAQKCPEWIEAVIYRKDRTHPLIVREYLDECYRPPFEKNGNKINGPWQTHTKRFLRHKAMIQAARLAFGFSGIYDEDEARRIVEGEIIDHASMEPPKRVDFAGTEAESAETVTVEPFVLTDEFGNEQGQFETPELFIDAAIDYLAKVSTANGALQAYYEYNEDELERLGSTRESELRQRFNTALNDRKAAIAKEQQETDSEGQSETVSDTIEGEREG